MSRFVDDAAEHDDGDNISEGEGEDGEDEDTSLDGFVVGDSEEDEEEEE